MELPPPTAEEAESRLFADPLIRGTLDHRDAIDAVITKHAKNWELHRIAAVDRNILRLAIYEMLHREDIPPVVSINEAVDIAKKFSTQDSGKFVNGILDKVQEELMRPARIVESRSKRPHAEALDVADLGAKNMFADLHLHSSFSDGTYSPEELAAHAARHGLAAIALTDHDTVEGCARAGRACAAVGIEFIAGTELTAEQTETRLHILGYFVDIGTPGSADQTSPSSRPCGRTAFARWWRG